MPTGPSIAAAEVVVAAPALDDELTFFRDRLGFRIETISPADDPSVAVVSGHGLRLRLDREVDAAPTRLRLLVDDGEAAGTTLTSPNGAVVELVPAHHGYRLPELRQSFTVSRLAAADEFGRGRAGMQYRDLVPDRQGGRFIASHIRIPGAGPVPDWVHYHDVRFQLIYCYRGAATLVYEDQGEPFRFQAGDCVLQPPTIRHRVLESFDDLEVIEVGCPARHDTHADHDMALPTGRVLPDREYGGQRFVHHHAATATWQPWRHDGYECRDTGIGTATDGLGGVRVVRPVGEPAPFDDTHSAELVFWFVLDGGLELRHSGTVHHLVAGDSVTLPAREAYGIAAADPALELLEVSLPSEVPDLSG